MHHYEIMFTREVTTTETVTRTIVAEDHLRAWRLADIMAAGFNQDSPADALVSDEMPQCDEWHVNPEDIAKIEGVQPDEDALAMSASMGARRADDCIDMVFSDDDVLDDVMIPMDFGHLWSLPISAIRPFMPDGRVGGILLSLDAMPQFLPPGQPGVGLHIGLTPDGMHKLADMLVRAAAVVDRSNAALSNAALAKVFAKAKEG